MRYQYAGGALWVVLVSAAHAQVLPNTEPGRIDERFEGVPAPLSLPGFEVPAPDARAFETDATDRKVHVSSVVIDGSSVYPVGAFKPLYADIIGRDVSLGDLYRVQNRITAKYRSDGYILSQAIIPAQTVTEGIVHISVVEGYIGNVIVEGDDHDARNLIERTADKVRRSKPLRLDDLERYLLLIGDMPGTSVSSQLRAASSGQAASELVLEIKRDRVVGSVAVDNRGSIAIGPEELSARFAFNSVLGLNEATRILYATTGQGDELQYGFIEHTQLFGTEGLKLVASGSISRTRPGGSIGSLDPEGEGATGEISLSAPVVRSRARSLSVGLGLTYIDSQTDLLGVFFSEDRLRVLSARASYDFADTVLGSSRAASSVFSISLDRGLDVLNASQSGDAGLSRANGEPHFTSASLEATRSQSLGGPWTIGLALKGQLSAGPLLSSAQFGVGGADIGRGYEPSEITGDSGLSGSAEMRFAPAWSMLDRPLIYAFYDAGKVWTHDAASGSPDDEALSSAGVGLRFGVGPGFTAVVELAKPLTRDVGSRGDRDVRPMFNFISTF